MINLALLFESVGDASKAEQHFERAFNILQKSVGLDHSETIAFFNKLAELYMASGDKQKLEALVNRVRKSKETDSDAKRAAN